MSSEIMGICSRLYFSCEHKKCFVFEDIKSTSSLVPGRYK